MLNSLLKIHKKTAIFRQGGGSSVDVILKPDANADGYPVSGYTNFVGLVFDDGDNGFFGDSFELTINADDLFDVTDKKPAEGWIANVNLPMMNNEKVDFYVSNVAMDRTLGTYLLKCSVITSEDNGCRVHRDNAGGI